MAVDHDERRQQIAQLAVRVIAHEGIEAATVRRIAQGLGFSTTIVTYYFQSKSELLLWAYRSLHDETYGKVQQIYQRDPTNLAACLLSMTAADEASFDRWRVYVAFWDRAPHEPEWAVRQHKDREYALGWIAKFIRARNGDLDNMANISRALNTFIQGLSVQALTDRPSWPRATILSEIERMIDLVIGHSTVAVARRVAIA